MLRQTKYKIVVILLAILLVLPLISPNRYLVHMMNMAGIYGLIAIGFNILAGYTGQISLGHAAFFGIGAYGSALMNVRFGLPFYITVLFSILVTSLCAFVLAIPALRIKGKYLVLLTIGFGEIVRLVLMNWNSLTNGPKGILGISSPSFFGLVFRTERQYSYLILIFLVLGYIYQEWLIRSRAGLALIAIREDEKAAELIGIDLTQYKIKAFIISGVYCAVAGSLYAHMVSYISPDSFRYEESVIILSMVIIGGIGTLPGPLLGAVLLTALPELLRSLGNMRLVIYGVMLILVIMYYPGGLVKMLERLGKALMTDAKAGEASK